MSLTFSSLLTFAQQVLLMPPTLTIGTLELTSALVPYLLAFVQGASI